MTARPCVRVPGALWRRTLDGALVLPPGADEPFALTPTAAAVWESLAEPRDADALVDELADRFDVERQRAAAEIRGLLDDLEARGAVRCLV